jgi:hypothetical protein
MGWATGMNWLGLLVLAATPCTAWVVAAHREQTKSAFDRLWLAYRDRFGFV